MCETYDSSAITLKQYIIFLKMEEHKMKILESNIAEKKLTFNTTFY